MKTKSGLKGIGNVSISDMATAIAQMEGYGTPGVWATINNNPGNLRSGVGQIGTNGGFAVFATPEDGYAALDNQIQLNISKGLTMDQFFGGLPGVYPGYAPAADSNNPNQYSAFVAGQLGIPTNVPLSQIFDETTSTTDATDTSVIDTSDPLQSLSDAVSSIDPTTLGVIGGLGIVGLMLLMGR